MYKRAQIFCSTLTDIVAISAAESGLAVARDPEVKSLAAALLVVVARALAAHAQQGGTHVRGVSVVADVATLRTKKNMTEIYATGRSQIFFYMNPFNIPIRLKHDKVCATSDHFCRLYLFLCST
jgi:hypothetical protein